MALVQRAGDGGRTAVTLMLVALIALSLVTIMRTMPVGGPLSADEGGGRPQTASSKVGRKTGEALFPDADGPGPAANGKTGDDPRMAKIRERFEQAVFMLHAGRYDEAVTALHTVLLLSPRLVAAHVNMGYALLGLKRYKAAADFFRQAIDIDPYQGNAYWGLAEALEAEGDLPAALGAMRTYIHLAKPGDPYVRRARSALWEWESRLEHGPPTPEAKVWMARRRKEDEARNAPDRDAPDATHGTEIPLSPSSGADAPAGEGP